jgi:hypothetical protein
MTAHKPRARADKPLPVQKTRTFHADDALPRHARFDEVMAGVEARIAAEDAISHRDGAA